MSDKESKILIVDDQFRSREVLRGLLSTQGYDLTFADSGWEALARVDESAPDVILLDVILPGIDGFEVCRRLKAEERWQHIPVILVTSLDDKEDMVRGFEAGADDFLSKPVDSLELRARVRSMLRLKKQFDALQAALQLREDMAQMIVHDMRTPLTAILGYTELLKQGIITSDDVEAINKLHRQVLHLNSLINDLLTSAKMEQGNLILDLSTVDINQLVQAVLENHSYIARLRQIDLVIKLPQKVRQVTVDTNLFKRVLDNLLSNAIKFSPPKSTVTLQAEYPESQNSHVRIKVLDQGPGVAVEDRERIFDKFEVAGIKQTGISQIGLGLAFCKLVVNAHGGRIFVESNKPQGSILIVEI